MKAILIFLLLPTFAAPSLRAAVILTRVTDSPLNFIRSPIEFDFDENESVDLVLTVRSERFSDVLEALIPFDTALAVGAIREDGFLGSFRRDSGFVIDALEGRPLFQYAEHWKDDPAELAQYRLGSYNFFGDIGEGDFGEEEGFLGFRFEGTAGKHYGYVEIRGSDSGRFSILSYAWESEPDTAIVAGAVPEPSTTLFLSLLAPCLWRRRRTEMG